MSADVMNKNNIRVAIIATAILAIGLILPVFASRLVIQNLFFVLTMLVLAQFWNLLAGFGGLVSVGQQAFVGLGAYAMFGGVILLGLSPISAIFLGGLVSLAIALPAAFIVFRLTGAYFAIGTWVISEVVRLLVAQWAALGGGTGTSLPRDMMSNLPGTSFLQWLYGLREAAARDVLAYILALIMAVSVILLIHRLLCSRWGLALSALRDNPNAAASVGVDIFRVRWLVYLVAAFGTGLCGALIFLQTARISPDAAFSVGDWSASIIFIVVIGGIGRLEGPVVGIVVFFLLRTMLADYGTWYLLTLGFFAIGVMLFWPKGICGQLRFLERISILETRRFL